MKCEKKKFLKYLFILVCSSGSRRAQASDDSGKIDMFGYMVKVCDAMRTTLYAQRTKHNHMQRIWYYCTTRTRARPPNKVNIAFEFI